jgi:hypothetical protein
MSTVWEERNLDRFQNEELRKSCEGQWFCPLFVLDWERDPVWTTTTESLSSFDNVLFTNVCVGSISLYNTRIMVLFGDGRY